MKLRRRLNPRMRDWTGMYYRCDKWERREKLPIWKLALWQIGKYLIKFGE